MRIVSIQTDIGKHQLLATQALVHDLYAQVVEEMKSTQATQEPKTTRNVAKRQTSRKRRRKR